jgi:hypothetical protein
MDALLHLGSSHAQPIVLVVAAIATFAVGLWIEMRRRTDDGAGVRFGEETDR